MPSPRGTAGRLFPFPFKESLVALSLGCRALHASAAPADVSDCSAALVDCDINPIAFTAEIKGEIDRLKEQVQNVE